MNGFFPHANAARLAERLAELAARTQRLIAASPARQAAEARRAPGAHGRKAPRATSAQPPTPRASPGSCAAETVLQRSHRPAPSAHHFELAADQVQRLGYGRISVGRISEGIDGSSMSAGFMATRLDALRAARARSVLVVVDSTGGDVREGLGICRALQRFSEAAGPVVVSVATAHSMGSIIAVAGDYVVADPFSSWLVHHPAGGPEHARAELDRALLERLTSRTLLDRETVSAWLDVEMTFNGLEAVSHGFADELGGDDRAGELAAIAARGASALPRTTRRDVLSARAPRKRG